VFFNQSHGVYSGGESVWDFENVWSTLCDGYGYPSLQWQDLSSVDECLGSGITTSTTTSTTLESGGGGGRGGMSKIRVPVGSPCDEDSDCTTGYCAPYGLCEWSPDFVSTATTSTATSLTSSTQTIETTVTTQTATTATASTVKTTTTHTTLKVTSTTLVKGVNQTGVGGKGQIPAGGGPSLLDSIMSSGPMKALAAGGLISMLVLLALAAGLLILFLLPKNRKPKQKGLANL